MGLNECSVFYGSTQSLNATKTASTSTYSLPTAVDVKQFEQMLKNHKNLQAKKYSYKDYPNDVKYGKIYAGIGCGGAAAGGIGGGGGGGGVGGGGSGIKKLFNNNSQNHNNNNMNVGKASKLMPATRIPTTKSMIASGAAASAAASSTTANDMDMYRSFSKKSSSSSSSTSASSSAFLWNSFRMPRKQKSLLSDKKRSGGDAESLRSGVDQTELQELNGQPSTPPMPRDSKRASLSQESLCVCGAAAGCNCQTEPKLKKCECKPLINTQKQTGSAAVAAKEEMLKQDEKDQENKPRNTASSKNKSSPVCEVIGKSCSSMTMIAHPRVDITIQYPALRPYTKNNVLDPERLTEFLEANHNEREQEHRQMMGLAVMVQFMSQKLDACACAETKEQCARDRSALEDTIGLLHQTQRDCEELRQELHAKDVEWAQRQQEREHLHRTELKQAEDKVMEVQMLAKQRFCELEAQLRAKDEEHKLVQEAYQLEVSHKLALKLEQLTTAEAQIMDLQSRLQKAGVQEQELRDRLIRKKNIHTTSIHEGAQREQELNERVQSLTKELNTLRASKEYSERDLRDRLTLSQDEISVLRTSSQQRSPSTRTSLSDTSAELCRLTSEAESLRCVLELKQAEISTLSKENADLKREGEERLKLSNQLDLLKSKNELLQLELETKAEKEKETQQKLDELQKAYNHESMKRTRLTFDKEEMVYLLKTRTEKLHNAEARLQERSLSSQDGSHCFSRSTNESVSSPTSPMIKGMIERNDSISWTLDIDGETPKVHSAKMVRRNGSLRGSNERSPIQRRQQAISNGHANGHSPSSLRNGTSSSVHRNGGPNPLSQSMSATALVRGSHSLSGESESESRTRSHSMCIKGSASTSAVCEKRHTSELATLGGELLLPDWNEDPHPVCSSSPHTHATLQSEMRPRSSTMKLMSSDANALKKFQEIQESAGEAMVSGANSEDESCSASSEDMMRSSTSSTASVGSLSKRPKQPSSRMSIEEALPCTPMEVSWSEDAADAEAEA
ncbi:nuclear mitotic apparatus protein 1 isoform X2 [Drosophila pseudoobscura]|uniref:Nuclear mitotic apparatus protein 1 isoform X2 n=1 Tax=Drosophila pseudoobscura pseudoobscura TaxID=46245 RepID=A0A6I8W0L2_DROPS|nr:nuclear mitotic apparatus protein 1 isoform X2 [Drosophila pseudoobscura]